MRTAGLFEQDTPQSDGVIFLGPANFLTPTAGVTLNVLGNGTLYYFTATATTSNIYGNVAQLLRTGALASQNSGYQAFGTKGPPPVPGPSSVANTSGPSALFGHPPILKANMPTRIGPVRGALPKGLQINYADVITSVSAANATSISFGLATVKFGAPGAGATASVFTPLITFGTNGLPVAVSANPVTIRIPVIAAQQVMIITDETSIQMQFQTVCAGSSQVAFYGVKLGVNYNYN